MSAFISFDLAMSRKEYLAGSTVFFFSVEGRFFGQLRRSFAEKSATKALKIYFKSMCASCPEAPEKCTVPEEPAEVSEDTTASNTVSTESKEKEKVVKSATDATKPTNSIRTGPYAGRVRYIPNLVLPAYRGVYTRIFDKWKLKVDKIIAKEAQEKDQKLLSK